MTPEIKDLLEKNTILIEQNNKLLKKLYRYQVWGFWFTLLWYVVLIISPLALYFYVFEPYLEAWNASYDSMWDTFKQVPGVGEFVNEFNASLQNKR